MLIAVILRQVPDTEAQILIDPANPAGIQGDDIKWVMNPYDEFAVEAAVSIAEENGAETLAVCIGSDKAEQVIRTAMPICRRLLAHWRDSNWSLAFSKPGASASARRIVCRRLK